MPPSRPTAAELLDAVRELLEREISPVLPADSRFQCRIAINILATVRRELELRSAFEARERERLATLLRDPSTSESLEALNRRLARTIRDGNIEIDGAELGEHLRRTIAEALQINNPRWLEESG